MNEGDDSNAPKQFSLIASDSLAFGWRLGRFICRHWGAWTWNFYWKPGSLKKRCTKTSSFRWVKLKPGKSTDALKANVWKECFPLFQSSAHAHVLVEGWLSDKLRRSWGAPQLLFLEKTTWPPSPLFAGKPAGIDSLTMEKTWTKEMIQTLQSNSRWLLVTLWRLVEGLDVSFADIEVLELEIFTESLEAWKNSCTKTSSFRWVKLKPGKSTDGLKANVWKECFPLFQSSAHAHVLVEGWLSDKLRRFWGAPQLLFLEKTTWPPSPLFAGKPAVIDLLTMEKAWNEGDDSNAPKQFSLIASDSLAFGWRFGRFICRHWGAWSFY